MWAEPVVAPKGACGHTSPSVEDEEALWAPEGTLRAPTDE